jgi:hypothetical protein
MEAGCEQYCEIELDQVDLQGDRAICISGSGDIPGHAAGAVDGPQHQVQSIDLASLRSGRTSQPRGTARCERTYLRLTA